MSAGGLSLGRTVMGQTQFSSTKFSNSKPWIELSREAYLHNAAMISKMSGGKPVLAVLKNNAYGLGDVQVSNILDQSPHIFGIAVVKDDRALAMRKSGVRKPILLMGDFDQENGAELVSSGVTLSVYSEDSFIKIRSLAENYSEKIKVALYIDTGLGRMGMPYQEVPSVAERIANIPNLKIEQTFSTLTTPKDFASQQIERFEQVVRQLASDNIPVGTKHLAPSYSILDIPESHQDVVRPGILLHGSFPMSDMSEAQIHPLKPAYRLKASVIRLEKLRKGDTIGFSRFYEVNEDEWIATLPIGWADGYNSGAENGAKVLLGGNLYSVVNVNASHTNVSLGDKTNIKVGDIATLIGSEKDEITPEGFGKLVNGHNYLQINYKESIPKQVYEAF